jgi:roadblock/LC7 domain-containing protein
MMKKPMPMKKGVMPAGMYADGGKVKGKAFKGKETMAEEKAEMKRPMKMADGGMVGSGCGPGYVADWNRKDMKK